jgi:hypothetical protein
LAAAFAGVDDLTGKAQQVTKAFVGTDSHRRWDRRKDGGGAPRSRQGNDDARPLRVRSA